MHLTVHPKYFEEAFQFMCWRQFLIIHKKHDYDDDDLDPDYDVDDLDHDDDEDEDEEVMTSRIKMTTMMMIKDKGAHLNVMDNDLHVLW